MSKPLRLHLFGSPQILWQDETITGFVSNKARALLIYLSVTRSAHSRNALAELFWSDTPATAKSNLRKTLSNLRNLSGVEFREDSSQSMALHLDGCWVDVVEFDQATKNALGADIGDALAYAAQLYQDDFLAGFNISVSYEFEAWALNEQIRLRAQMVDVLYRLAEVQTQRDELASAIATVRRLLGLEPWREEAHRQLMELLASSNEPGTALAQFEICKEKLQAELDVEPSAATRELAARIRAGDYRQSGQEFTGLSPLQATTKPANNRKSTTTVEYPLVGREKEWQIVRTIWQELAHPYCISINGEAGIGKTRLTEELLVLVESGGQAIARTRCHALQGQLAYGPITDWLRAPPLQAALAKIDRIWLTEIARLLPRLFVTYPDLPPPQPLQEGWQRKRFFDALVYAFAEVQQPLLLVLDDIQWCDSDTLEWMQYFLERMEKPLLIVGTVRTDEIDIEHPLHRVRQQLLRRDRLTEIDLMPLSQRATAELAAHSGQQRLSGSLAERLFQDTAGNPLFVIESMRATPTGISAGKALLENEEYPDRVQLFMPPKIYHVIQARLAQLSPQAQALAQIGATIGRAFDAILLAQAQKSEEAAILPGLDELWQRRIIRGVESTRFDFSHDRIRDVAYAEISPVKRQFLHRQVANALMAIHAENLESVAGHLAIHFAAAGMLEEALTFHQRAAEVARGLFAHQEALNHRQQALALLRQLPKSTENLHTRVVPE